MARGKFITVEGIDGSGKTTQISFIVDFLKRYGYEIIYTREPGGTPLAENIRQTLLNRENIKISPITELLLYLASRAQHTYEVINPSLENGIWVVSDRYHDSSVAYQGAGRGIGEEQVWEMSLFSSNGLIPDLTILIDIEPETAIMRMKNCGKIPDRLENENLSFIKNVRRGYLWTAERFKERVKVVNGEKKIEDLWEDVKRILIECLSLEI